MSKARSLISILLAFAALAVCAPQALAAEFEASELPATVTGVGKPNAIFAVGGSAVSCTGATYTGELTEVGSTLSLSPVFTGCKIFSLSVTATTSGCEIVLDLAGGLVIACEAGSSIKFKDAFNLCQVSVPAQSGLASVTYEDSEAKAEPTVTFAASLTGVTATAVGPACPIAPGTYNTATFINSGYLEAKGEEAEAVGLWIEKPRILCKQKPAGNPPVCPQGYAGDVNGELKQNAVFLSTAGATGSVTCNAATFTGEKFTEEGKGSVKIVYNGGADCESKITGLTKPKVTLEKGNAYTGSEFIYIRPTPFEGRIWLTTTPPAVAKLDLEGEELTCSYELKSSSANVFNPVAVGEEVKPMEAKLIGTWIQSAGGAKCPTKLRSETIFKLERGGGGNLWVTRQ